MKILLTFMFTFLALNAMAQQIPELKSRNVKKSIPITIAFSTHTYSWPFYKSFSTPLQTGFKLGSEYPFIEKNKHSLLQTVNIGYFKNPELMRAYYLNSFFTYRYTIVWQLYADCKIGIGYMHRMHTREVFKLSNNGDYKKATDWGKPSFNAGFNLGLGYNFSIKNEKIGVFLEYDWYVNYPYVKDEIPFMAHSQYHIGAKYFFKRK